MEAMAFQLYRTKPATVLAATRDRVAVLMDEGVRIAPANKSWSPGARVEVLVRDGVRAALAVRAVRR